MKKDFNHINIQPCKCASMHLLTKTDNKTDVNYKYDAVRYLKNDLLAVRLITTKSSLR